MSTWMPSWTASRSCFAVVSCHCHCLSFRPISIRNEKAWHDASSRRDERDTPAHTMSRTRHIYTLNVKDGCVDPSSDAQTQSVAQRAATRARQWPQHFRQSRYSLIVSSRIAITITPQHWSCTPETCDTTGSSWYIGSMHHRYGGTALLTSFCSA